MNAPSEYDITEACNALQRTRKVQLTTYLRNALVALINHSEEASTHTVYQLYYELLRPKGTRATPSIPMMARQFMCFLAMDMTAHASKLGLSPASSTANPDGSSSSSTTPSAGKEAVGSLTGAGN